MPCEASQSETVAADTPEAFRVSAADASGSPSISTGPGSGLGLDTRWLTHGGIPYEEWRDDSLKKLQPPVFKAV